MTSHAADCILDIIKLLERCILFLHSDIISKIQSFCHFFLHLLYSVRDVVLPLPGIASSLFSLLKMSVKFILEVERPSI